MLALRGVYENGEFKLNKPIITKKPLNFIITFIDENFQFTYQAEEKIIIEDYKQQLLSLKEKYSNLPIKWSEKKPNPDDFFGIWANKNINLMKLREKAWNRK